MFSTHTTTVVGVFNARGDALRAIDALGRAGFPRDSIGIAVREDETSREPARLDESLADDGAATGAAIGASIGGLVGLGVLTGMIPVIGPAIVGGTLGTILSNAAGGAALAGLAGALVGAGVSEPDAAYYEEEFHEGRTIVTVHAGIRAEEARSLMEANGGVTDVPASTHRAL